MQRVMSGASVSRISKGVLKPFVEGLPAMAAARAFTSTIPKRCRLPAGCLPYATMPPAYVINDSHSIMKLWISRCDLKGTCQLVILLATSSDDNCSRVPHPNSTNGELAKHDMTEVIDSCSCSPPAHARAISEHEQQHSS